MHQVVKFLMWPVIRMYLATSWKLWPYRVRAEDSPRRPGCRSDGGVHIAQGHGYGGGPQSVEALHIDLAVRQTDLLSLEVSGSDHLGLGHQLTLAVDPVGREDGQALVRQLGTSSAYQSLSSSVQTSSQVSKKKGPYMMPISGTPYSA